MALTLNSTLLPLLVFAVRTVALAMATATVEQAIEVAQPIVTIGARGTVYSE